jgi:hypothetical protein
VRSTQLPLQLIGAADGHPETHEYAPPAPAQTGVAPPHVVPQLPQLAALAYSTHTPPQRLYPVLHENEQVPAVQVAWACATSVEHALPQLPQLVGLVGSLQLASHASSPPSHETCAVPSSAGASSAGTNESEEDSFDPLAAPSSARLASAPPKPAPADPDDAHADAMGISASAIAARRRRQRVGITNNFDTLRGVVVVKATRSRSRLLLAHDDVEQRIECVAHCPRLRRRVR